MTRLLEQALRQLESLSEEDQDAAAGALMEYLAHQKDSQLTEEQMAEIRRRRADPDRSFVSHEAARIRMQRFGA